MFFVFIKSLFEICIFFKVWQCTCIYMNYVLYQLHFVTIISQHVASITLISLHFDFITMISFCDFTGNNSWNYLWTINCGTCSSESWPMVPSVYHCCRCELCWCYYLPKSECSKSSAVGKWMSVQIDQKNDQISWTQALYSSHLLQSPLINTDMLKGLFLLIIFYFLLIMQC